MLADAPRRVLRDRATSHGAFRRALEEASAILAIEAHARPADAATSTVDTPLEPANGKVLLGEVAIVPVLRAGLGMVDGFLRLLPDARVGHLGMYRDEEDHCARRLLRVAAAGLGRVGRDRRPTRCSRPAAAPSTR